MLKLTECQSKTNNTGSTHGLIKMCAQCKRIRNECGQWQVVDVTAIRHLEENISHGFCATCFKALYPHFDYPTSPDPKA